MNMRRQIMSYAMAGGSNVVGARITVAAEPWHVPAPEHRRPVTVERDPARDRMAERAAQDAIRRRVQPDPHDVDEAACAARWRDLAAKEGHIRGVPTFTGGEKTAMPRDHQTILYALTRPMLLGEISDATGICRKRATDVLVYLRQRGHVTAERIEGGRNLYRRAE